MIQMVTGKSALVDIKPQLQATLLLKRAIVIITGKDAPPAVIQNQKLVTL